jgi:hypothetical protein
MNEHLTKPLDNEQLKGLLNKYFWSKRAQWKKLIAAQKNSLVSSLNF